MNFPAFCRQRHRWPCDKFAEQPCHHGGCGYLDGHYHYDRGRSDLRHHGGRGRQRHDNRELILLRTLRR
jgi:hypothetical protein